MRCALRSPSKYTISVLTNCVVQGLARCALLKSESAVVRGPRRCHSGSGGIVPGVGMDSLGEGVVVVVRGGVVLGVFVAVVRFGAGRRRRGGGRRRGAAARRPALRRMAGIWRGVRRGVAWCVFCIREGESRVAMRLTRMVKTKLIIVAKARCVAYRAYR
jgi:hypothetical protein